MRRDYRSLASLLILVAACGGGGSDPDAAGAADSSGFPDAVENPDAPGTPDAMLPDAYIAALDCLGDPLPGDGEADDPVTISGDIFDPGIPGFVPETQLSGITLDSFAYGDESNKLDSDVSAATTGAFSLTAATGNNPLNAYIRAQQQPIDGNNSYITTYLYPGAPQATSQTGIRIPMISESTFNLLEQFSELSQDDDLGLVTVIVVDCEGTPLPNATVSSTPAAGTTAYIADGAPSIDVNVTDSSGLAFLINVPIPEADTTAEVEVTATYDGMPLRAHFITVREFLNPLDDLPNPDDEHRMVTTQVVP